MLFSTQFRNVQLSSQVCQTTKTRRDSASERIVAERPGEGYSNKHEHEQTTQVLKNKSFEQPDHGQDVIS